LRQPHKGAPPGLPQVPEMFRDRNHPSYRACLEFVQRCEARRNRQLRLKKECELCLQYEQVDRPEDLPSAPLYPIDREILEELRRGLQRSEVPLIPLEAALQRMTTMRMEEPQDACGLQETMAYTDRDDDGRRYESLERIQQIITRKVVQIQAAKRWLRLVSVRSLVEDAKYPGTVNWPEEKLHIEHLRDTDPIKGLPEAQRLCKRIRDGDEQGICMVGQPPVPRWALVRAVKELAPEALLSYVRAAMSDSEATELRLCAVVQVLDRQRAQLGDQLRRHIQETHTYEIDLGQRGVRFRSAADPFMKAYTRLVNSSRLRASDVMAFNQAADDLGGICPRWADFQHALDDVYRKHGINHPRRQKQSNE
jgi:hypothetical protein